jgi:hypothetical protein
MYKKVILTLPFLLTNVYAMGEQTAAIDPLQRIDYRSTFNQTALYEKYASTLRPLGLADNLSIGDSSASAGAARSDGYVSISVSDTTDIMRTMEFKKFEADCHELLKHHRRMTLLQPAREAGTLMALMGGASVASIYSSGSNSFGGSFTIFAAMFNCVWFVRDIIRSGYNLYQTPSHPLDAREVSYALNKCFIPKEIWPILEEKFMMARTNPFEARAALDFIDFSLALTTLRPKAVAFDVRSYDTLRHQLRAHINNFFTSYEPFDDARSLSKVRADILNFLKALTQHHKKQPFDAPRPIFMNGPGGIGKTHFSRSIQKFIGEHIGDCVQFHDITIGDPTDLEGDESKPGLLLRVLQKICTGNALGAVLFMDEATWLNDDHYISTAKRVFNGTLSTLKTSYFGSGVDGTGLDFKLPPILVMVAANEEIKDLALKSRFDNVLFPVPMQTAIVSYGGKLLEKEMLQIPMAERISGESRSLFFREIERLTSFRGVEEFVPGFIESLEDL